MPINPESVLGFVLKELGYGEAFIQKFLPLLGKNGAALEAVVTAIQDAIDTDSAAFAAGTAVVSPSVGASIDGHAYKLTVHADPA
jgi:hypothetical protein